MEMLLWPSRLIIIYNIYNNSIHITIIIIIIIQILPLLRGLRTHEVRWPRALGSTQTEIRVQETAALWLTPSDSSCCFPFFCPALTRPSLRPPASFRVLTLLTPRCPLNTKIGSTLWRRLHPHMGWTTVCPSQARVSVLSCVIKSVLNKLQLCLKTTVRAWGRWCGWWVGNSEASILVMFLTLERMCIVSSTASWNCSRNSEVGSDILGGGALCSVLTALDSMLPNFKGVYRRVKKLWGLLKERLLPASISL